MREMEFLEFFNHRAPADFMPHGCCYQRHPWPVWPNVLSDGLITLSYYCIPHSFEHPPEVVLFDVKLPKVDGIEVLKQLKQVQRTKAIPVIAPPDFHEAKASAGEGSR